LAWWKTLCHNRTTRKQDARKQEAAGYALAAREHALIMALNIVDNLTGVVLNYTL